jgi:hypothetical protein
MHLSHLFVRFTWLYTCATGSRVNAAANSVRPFAQVVVKTVGNRAGLVTRFLPFPHFLPAKRCIFEQ